MKHVVFRRTRSSSCCGIRLIILLTALCNLALTYPQPTRAALLVGNVNGGAISRVSPDGKFTTVLSPIPVEKIDGPTTNELNLLKGLYPKWGFIDGDAATGKFHVLQYDAFGLNQRGGADFTVLYNDEVATPRTDLSWVQIGYPKNWGAADSIVFNDSSFSNFPFYANYTPVSFPNLSTPSSFFGDAIWLDTTNYPQQKIQNPAGGGKIPVGDLFFVDEPWCLYSCVIGEDTTSLVFSLFLVSFTWNQLGGSNAGGIVTLHDGIRWGVEIFNIPEPDTSSLSVVALLLIAIVKRRPQKM